MKHTHYFKWTFFLLFSAFVSFASAKEIYLSTTGFDTNDGLTAGTPVLTFNKAYGLSTDVTGDVIHVSGMIDISTDPGLTIASTVKAGYTVRKNITIQGSSPNSDGFDGKSLTRIFQLTGPYALILKNLTLKNGKFLSSNGNGGALSIAGSKVSCENVIFDSNLVFDTTCSGGAVFVNGTTGLSFINCLFLNNNGASGGAIRIFDAATINAEIRISACSFVNNTSNTGGGAAINIRMPGATMHNTVNIINSTFTGNNSHQGTIYCYSVADPNASVNLTNCTVTANKALATSVGCSGIFVLNSLFLGKLNINNSIIEGNFSGLSGTLPYSDIAFDVAPTVSNLMIHNSFIGRNGGTKVVPTECYPGDNQFNYLSTASIMFDLKAKFAVYDDARKMFPLLANSPAINYGDAQYLQSFGVNTDQVGTIRSFGNNKCYAGAVELTGLPITIVGTPTATYKHLIIYGQSLSTGHQSYPVISTENIAGNYMLGDQLWINYGNTQFTSFNPLVGSISNAFKTTANIMNRSAGTIAECPLFGAVNHIQLKQPGEKLLATSCGTSGMTIEQLSKESQTKTYYSDFTKALNYANYTALNSNSAISCPAIFWMQGEWNYQGYGEGLTLGSVPTPDKDAYKVLLLTLKNNMQTDVQNIYGQSEKPLFITYQTGVQYTKGKELAIGMAQLEASNENADVICAGSVSQMTDRGGHLDSNGYRWYGEMMGKVYYKTNVLHEKFKPLQPQEISKTTLPNQLKLKFLVPVLPLVMDSLILPKVKDYGFEVYSDNVKQTITAVKIIDDCVFLTCFLPLTGVLEVVYAGVNTVGNGNLRDSDPYASFFKYIDLDKKNSDGTYFFPRDATETTLRPAYEPKDASGNVIYDKAYPLFNFGVSFYYKIAAMQQTLEVPNVVAFTNSVFNTLANDGINVYQSSNSLVVQMNTINKKNIHITFYNASSGTIQSVLTPDSSSYEKVYSLASFTKGVYIAKIEQGDNRKTVKLIIH